MMPNPSTDPVAAAALFAASLLACAAILAALLKTGWAWRLAIDHPNERSLHERPTPRCGGIGVVVATLGLVLWLAPQLVQLMTGFAALALLSLVDDRRGLPIVLRFLVHALAILAVWWGAHAGLSWWQSAVCIFLWLWLTNLYNFMDGANGMAGLMTLAGFLAYALAILQGDGSPLAIVALAAAGGSLGFLFFNYPRARVFLGDIGSIPLGFLAGGVGFLGWRAEAWPAWFPFWIFSPFIVDASVTLLRRLARRERVWQAHREHYYQRLIRSGYSHARVSAIYAVLMLAAVASGLALMHAPDSTIASAALVGLGILVGVGLGIDRRAQLGSSDRIRIDET